MRLALDTELLEQVPQLVGPSAKPKAKWSLQKQRRLRRRRPQNQRFGVSPRPWATVLRCAGCDFVEGACLEVCALAVDTQPVRIAVAVKSRTMVERFRSITGKLRASTEITRSS